LQLMHNHLVYTAVLQHRLAIVCITQQLQSIRVDSGLEQAKSPPTGKRQTSGNLGKMNFALFFINLGN
ncbi:unnamed protein product, partial [Rotaria magnacalcarata]